MKRLILFCVLAISCALPVRAITLTVEVVDYRTLNLGISGTIVGPAASWNAGILWVHAPVGSGFFGDYQSISGDLKLGSLALHSVHSGYNNYYYGGSLQLRGSLNGVTPFQVGDTVSGSATVLFRSGGHGLTQSMFDGPGVPIYWGQHGTPGFSTAQAGTLQGYAVSKQTAPVPENGATALLLAPAIGALAAWRRRKAVVGQNA